jgi:hypothetical protein
MGGKAGETRLQRGQRRLRLLGIARGRDERAVHRRAEFQAVDHPFARKTIFRDVVPRGPQRARREAGRGVGGGPQLAPVVAQHPAVIEDHGVDRALDSLVGVRDHRSALPILSRSAAQRKGELRWRDPTPPYLP